MELDVCLVRDLVEVRGCTFDELSQFLKNKFPGENGFSVSTLKRFCSQNGIHRRHNFITNDSLDQHVTSAVKQVGGKYGRRMMTGLLRSKGLAAGEGRVGKSLKRVNPQNHFNRQHGMEKQLNPKIYHADYFGYNLHMDQNEKLVDFGVTYVLAIDGLSSFIPAYSVMPIKNNGRIYSDVFSAAVRKYGLWETVIVDCGREFYLTLLMQQYYRERLTTNSSRICYRQIKSTDNNRIERIWSEVNQRVSFPIKSALLDLEHNSNVSHFDMADLFSISSVCRPVAEYGVVTCINAWNHRTIPGRGIPASFVSSRRNTTVPSELELSADDATQTYEQCGGRLTEETTRRQERDVEFWSQCEQKIGGVADIFSSCANNSYSSLQRAICLHRDLTLTML